MARTSRRLAGALAALALLGCSDDRGGSDRVAMDPALGCEKLGCRDDEYCQQIVSDVGGAPDMFTCEPLPPTCPVPGTCACLKEASVACHEFGLCRDSERGPTMVCPGG